MSTPGILDKEIALLVNRNVLSTITGNLQLIPVDLKIKRSLRHRRKRRLTPEIKRKGRPKQRIKAGDLRAGVKHKP